MKYLYILLITSLSYAQEYSFQNILDKSLNKNETIHVKGYVILTTTEIFITTHNGTKQLYILGKIPFYLQNQTIYRCMDENDNLIRVFWVWTEEQRKYVDMIFMSDNIYYIFCLTHKKQL